MASFPGKKTHRTSRRRLGKGQHVHKPKLKKAYAAGGGHLLQVSFNQPAIVSGSLDPGVQGATLLSQTQLDATTWSLEYDQDLMGLDYDGVGEDDPSTDTFQGGGCEPVDSGTI